MYKQQWEQVDKEFSKESKHVSLGIDLERFNAEEYELHCNYSGDISIDDKEQGVVLTKHGHFIQNYKINSKVISKQIDDIIENPNETSVSISCNLTNQVAPIFWANSIKMKLNPLYLENLDEQSSFCCLSATNLLSSYGADCPKSSKNIFEHYVSCTFSSVIVGDCNGKTAQRTNSRFCKISDIKCVLEEYFQSPCDFPNKKMNVCNFGEKKCSLN